jgi:hypothetical protein
MTKTAGWMIARLALAGFSLIAASSLSITASSASGGATQIAQLDKEPPKLPEVNPRLDNPNNPAVPGSPDTDAQSNRPMTPPSGAATEGKSRCGTLTDTLARRRCLEELQRNRNN